MYGLPEHFLSKGQNTTGGGGVQLIIYNIPLARLLCARLIMNIITFYGTNIFRKITVIFMVT